MCHDFFPELRTECSRCSRDKTIYFLELHKLSLSPCDGVPLGGTENRGTEFGEALGGVHFSIFENLKSVRGYRNRGTEAFGEPRGTEIGVQRSFGLGVQNWVHLGVQKLGVQKGLGRGTEIGVQSYFWS